MNKISMSKTYLYNFSYKKSTGSLQQPVATGILCYSTQSSDSRWLLGGVRVQTSMSVRSCCCTQNAVYQRFIYLYDIAAEPHEVFLKEMFGVVCF